MKRNVLVVGDLLALLIVTVIGFLSHGELSLGFFARMAAAFVPLCAGWFLLAPSLGLFDEVTAGAVSELWRPAFVVLFAGPFATLVRSILLGSSLIPSFAVVFSLSAAIALTAWRSSYVLYHRRVRRTA